MITIGLILAGLFLIVRPVPGILKGNASGVLIGKGYGAPRIERAVEPERFRALIRKRYGEMLPGVVILGIAVAWEVVNFIGIVALTPQPPV